MSDLRSDGLQRAAFHLSAGLLVHETFEIEVHPLRAASSEQEVDSLVTIPFFHDMERKNLQAVGKLFKRKRFNQGDVVVKEGAKESVFHLIINGSVRVTAADAEGKAVALQELKNGDWFGDVSSQSRLCTLQLKRACWQVLLVQDNIQAVSVTALEDNTTILMTNSDEFSHAVERYPQLGVSVDVVGRNPPLKVQLKKIPFFADVNELKLQVLSQLCALRKVPAGAKICTQGDEADGVSC